VDNEKKIGETFDGLHKTLDGTGRMFEKHEGDVTKIIERLNHVAEEAEKTIVGAREKYVEDPRIDRILSRLDHTTRVLDENLEPMMKDSRLLLEDGRKVSAFLSNDQQLQTISELAKETRQTLTAARSAAQDASDILAHVKKGRGTAGALLMDETLFDDLQELFRDLKHNPWKIMWKN
jgi:phospholipid/cholesterol/gamma-HCH transport system substrate-binding protein